MRVFSIGDMVQFVLKNRGSKCFIGHSEAQVCGQLYTCMENGTLLYTINDNAELNGIIIAEIRESEGVLFVAEALTEGLHCIREIVKTARKRWPDLRLEWWRRGIHKRYNTERIYRKLGI